MMISSGSCLCGAVTLAASRVDAGVHVCHCSMCRRWCGGPVFATQAGEVTFTGERHIQVYASSGWAERGFCSRCGSALFYRLKETGDLMVSVGLFDDQSAFTLASEIFIDDKPPGYAIAGDHPRLTGEQFLASL
jgi:hypothetical protein